MNAQQGSDRALTDAVKAAIEETLGTDTESMIGYALCTDDSLVTLYSAQLTREDLDVRGDPDLLFCPVDWPRACDGSAFGAVIRELRAREETEEELIRHVDRAFAVLVEALVEMKAGGALREGVFLSVLSTDPSDYLERLEAEGIQTLNTGAIVEERRRFIEKWQ